MPAPFDPAETQVLNQISRQKLWETNRQIAEWTRLSGSRDERLAFEYVRGLLDSYGLHTTWLEHPALISYPLEATLNVIDATGAVLADHTCLSHAFSASTDSLEGQVVDLGFGTPADYAAHDVRGKVALINGLATPTGVYAAEQAGCGAEIFINDDHLHNMIVSTIWGTPTPRSAVRLPKTPVVSVVRESGEQLRARIAKGATRVRIRTLVFTGWQSTPIVVGDLPGRENDDFVMFSGHLDSWDQGAMDNGSANATMLEIARVTGQQREQLRRGLRIIFWSGHSHGRYSGSTWYADNFWEELYDRCIAHVNVDSTGARGATYYGSFPAHAELANLGVQVIEQHTGQHPRPYRMSRAGDMSFNGIGIPSLFMELSQVPSDDGDSNQVSMSLDESTGGKMPWWWHTSEDTIDKVDLDVLELDTKVYLSAVWRLCQSALLPMDFRPVVKELEEGVASLTTTAGGQLDLRVVQGRVNALSEHVTGLAGRVATAVDPEEIKLLNRKLKMLSRILIPITYVSASRFEHDPAWAIPFLSGLQDARRLAQLSPDEDSYHLLKTELVRSRNALSFSLRQALDSIAV
jgi:Iap family predicted aminopeptidase